MPIKSNKALPKTNKGLKYIVFTELPEDQQKAWKSQSKKGEDCFTCPFIKKEPVDAICIYYHDYENFYDNWIVGLKAVHLD